jgi:hypothetical protein
VPQHRLGGRSLRLADTCHHEPRQTGRCEWWDGVAHVFISYARDDAADYVDRLVAHLTGSGIKVFYDRMIKPGQRWTTTIPQMIDTCAVFLLVMTPAADASPVVREELLRAQRSRRPVMTLRRAGKPAFLVAEIQYDDVADGRMPSPIFLGELRAHLDGHVEEPTQVAATGWRGRRPWMAPPLDSRTVQRPELSDQVVDLLTGGEATVGLTTGVFGAGGFGKTTLAAIVCHRPEVSTRFPGGLVWATIGENPAREQLVATINDLCEQLTGERSTLSSPEQAGFHLGQLLDQRPATLLVVDDVWRQQDLKPFLLGGASATRLVTTRMAAVLPDDARLVEVDRLRADQARELLTAGLPPLPPETVQRLLTLTGGWALVVAMANGQLRRQVHHDTDAAPAAHQLIERLAALGPAGAQLSTRAGREQTIAATVGRSLDLLDNTGRRRYLDLAVFPEDTDIPLDVLSILWDCSTMDTRLAGEELAELSLVQDYQRGSGTLRLHDVLRSHLCHENGADQLRRVHSGLIDKAAGRLVPSIDGDPGAAAVAGQPWWALPDEPAYLWHRLTYHLHEAGREGERAALLADLRWVEEKTRRFAATSVDVDLAYGSDATTDQLRRTVTQQAHLLGPVTPAHSHADILASRLGTNPRLSGAVDEFVANLGGNVTRLTNHWAPPDADPRLLRTLTGHTNWVTGVAIAPDGTWLATTSHDRTVRIWDAVSGVQRAQLDGHTSVVTGVAIAPDGTWLATTSRDQTVRIWDATTGRNAPNSTATPAR